LNGIALKGVLRKPRSLRESALTKAQDATKIPAGPYQKFSTNARTCATRTENAGTGVVPSPGYRKIGVGDIRS